VLSVSDYLLTDTSLIANASPLITSRVLCEKLQPKIQQPLVHHMLISSLLLRKKNKSDENSITSFKNNYHPLIDIKDQKEETIAIQSIAA